VDICVVGAGVIGCVYGCVLDEAGHRVTHLVRSGGARLSRGLEIELLDARGAAPVERNVVYRPTVIDRLDGARPFDVILASVRHYQLEQLLPTLAEVAGESDVVLFSNWWSTLAPVDAVLGDRYVWAFPVAGGGFDGDRLVAALLDHIVLGESAGRAERVARVAEVFAGAGLAIEPQPDMLAWLWVHFAVEAGVIAVAINSGGVDAFLDDVPALIRAVLVVREALSVVAARGVAVEQVPEAAMWFAPEAVVAQAIFTQYQSDVAARRIMQRHTGGSELARIVHDVVGTGHELGVSTPLLEKLVPAVDAYAMAGAEPDGGS
jgi:2-dehydropantoate 2-reductase